MRGTGVLITLGRIAREHAREDIGERRRNAIAEERIVFQARAQASARIVDGEEIADTE